MFSARSLSSKLAVLRRAPSSALGSRRSAGDFPKMPVPQSQDVKPFQGHPAYEGWEGTVGFYTVATIFLLGVNYFFAPNTDINSWARNEAAARLRLKEEQGFTDFEFGKHYQDQVFGGTRRAAWDAFTMKAINYDDDDDDDDDDEDEDDDEEE